GRAECLSRMRTDVKAHKGLFALATTPGGYGPADPQSAHALPSGTAGAGGAGAIVGALCDPEPEARLGPLRPQDRAPPGTTANGCFEKVNQQGQQGSYPTPNSGWATEESLDVDMVSAACPLCHILLVESDDNTINNMGLAVNEAVALGAKYVSNSWGSDEY